VAQVMDKLLPTVIYFLDVQHKIHCRYYFLIWEFSTEDVSIHSFWSGKLPIVFAKLQNFAMKQNTAQNCLQNWTLNHKTLVTTSINLSKVVGIQVLFSSQGKILKCVALKYLEIVHL
jgi:hypothetical protein